jgi:hypothetical protein
MKEKRIKSLKIMLKAKKEKTNFLFKNFKKPSQKI